MQVFLFLIDDLNMPLKETYGMNRFREGCHENRRCSRDTYPELCIAKCTTIRSSCLKPHPSQVFLFLIDDLNMPLKETYGAQPPIELLRQIINTKVLLRDRA